MEEIKFKTGQEVLVRRNDECVWHFVLYSHFNDGLHSAAGQYWSYCIPYKNNEHLVGTTDSPKEDLPIDTPVMCCTHPQDGWCLKYYAGNNKAYFKKSDSELNAYSYNYIIKVKDFDFNNPENSLKHNIVNKRK